ncbi:MAG: hypothetical protein ACE37J_21760 [Pikeienuella sp.]|uniref:hypothetical protein n=1 Tax=Pikeienuella sp. TaxID=2831957 RepID=UPI003919F768
MTTAALAGAMLASLGAYAGAQEMRYTPNLPQFGGLNGQTPARPSSRAAVSARFLNSARFGPGRARERAPDYPRNLTVRPMTALVSLRMALFPLLLAAPALANEARIQQGGGAITDFRLEQAPGGGHWLGGVETSTLPAEPGDLVFKAAGPAAMTGDFSKVHIAQSGVGGRVGLDVDADTLEIDISTAGADTVLLYARAGDLSSTVEASGVGARTVNLYVNAAGETVSHDLTLSGAGDLMVNVSQTAAASLSVDITALGGDASATFNQSGAGASANVMATLDDGAALTLNQTMPDVMANFTTNIGAGGSLTVNQTVAPGTSVSLATTPEVASVGAGHQVTVTQ